MQEIFIGEAIKRRRLELKLTQEKLCEGICEPITISRLENGRQSPSRNLVNALLERLDMPSDRYYALVSKDELEIEDLQAKIAYWDIRFEQTQDVQARVEAIKTHEALQRKMKLEDRISQQLILRSLAILGKEDGPFSPEEKQEMLFRAIRLTAPNFDVSHFEDGLYTANEIKIINQLALNYERLGDQSTTIDILHRLSAYMEQHCRCDRASKGKADHGTVQLCKQFGVCGRIRASPFGSKKRKRYLHRVRTLFVFPGIACCYGRGRILFRQCKRQ